MARLAVALGPVFRQDLVDAGVVEGRVAANAQDDADVGTFPGKPPMDFV